MVFCFSSLVLYFIEINKVFMYKINIVSFLVSDKLGREIGLYNYFIFFEGRFFIKFWVIYILFCKDVLEIMSLFFMKYNRICVVKVEIKNVMKLLRRCLEIWLFYFMGKGNWFLSIERVFSLFFVVELFLLFCFFYFVCV